MFHVYILRNPKGKLYKGFTNNLEKRFSQHNANDGLPSYTRSRGNWELVYQECFANAKEARKREKFLKSGQGRTFLKKILR